MILFLSSLYATIAPIFSKNSCSNGKSIALTNMLHLSYLLIAVGLVSNATFEQSFRQCLIDNHQLLYYCIENNRTKCAERLFYWIYNKYYWKSVEAQAAHYRFLLENLHSVSIYIYHPWRYYLHYCKSPSLII